MGQDPMVAIYRKGQCLLQKVRVAQRFDTRLRGLMFYPEMPGIDGLLLYPCHAVHMFWMRFGLSLIYMDQRGQVVQVVDRIDPNRIGPVVKKAYYVLETIPGLPAQRQISCGDQLQWDLV